MNMLRVLLGITLIFSLSCTEEISEELKNSTSSDALTDAEKFVNKSIRLDHKMNEGLSYRMHKAGSRTLDCELAPPALGFDAADYLQDEAAYGTDPQIINCFLEAQELDLYQNGATVELTVDEFLCEYITYEPFKFWTHPAGRTDRVLYKVECNDDDCDLADYCGNTYESIDITGPTVTFSGLVEPSDEVCRFDHTENDGPNCDIGRIRTITYSMPGTFDAVPADNTCGTNYIATSEVETQECGGDMTACFGGPAVDELDDPTLSSIVYPNEDLESFTQSFTIQAPLSRIGSSDIPASNMYVSNYSRICSLSNGDKTDINQYGNTSPFIANDTHFTDKELENLWRTNRFDDGVTTVDYLQLNNTTTLNYPINVGKLLNPDASVSSPHSTITNGAGAEYEAIGYTENAWRGVYRTSSYYAFRCLDKAYDTKAQIRLFIREWDRAYSDTIDPISFEYISDIATTTPLMDSDATTVDGEEYNNIYDWDDFFIGNATQTGQRTWMDDECTVTEENESFTGILFPGNL